MKNESEMQRVHDLFVAIITDEIKPKIDRNTRKNIHASLDVLCWALDHDHNSTFACNIRKVRKAVADAGYVEHEGRELGNGT